LVNNFNLFRDKEKIDWYDEKILNNAIKSEDINFCLRQQIIEFNYGVASGDPTSNSIILWTHSKYKNFEYPVTLFYQVAKDEKFKEIIKSGIGSTNEMNDFTLQVEIQGLKDRTIYYYRFGSTNNKHSIKYSIIGRTNTIPCANENISNLKLAVVSCANYPQGYFNVYKEVGKETDICCVVHLGDYTYEYSNTDSYGTPINESRASKPPTECVTLSDYRIRHAQYKQDPDLQYMHSRYPIIAVWDDHEVVDNAWKDGAPTVPNKYEFLRRKRNGLDAYCEWMPVKVKKCKNNIKIYRSFDFGNLFSLHMIDSRYYGREKQIDPVNFIVPETRKETNDKLNEEQRQLLGDKQFNWLNCKIKSSTAKWQVLGSQVLMSKIQFPVSILQFASSPINPELINQAIIDYLIAKQTPPEFRTPEQKFLVDTSLNANPLLGYNLDAWDGYPAQRENLFKSIQKEKKNFVTISGDSHNGWFNKLVDDKNNLVGYEFGVPSVSSYGLEYFLSPLPPLEIKTVFETIPQYTEYLQPKNRGYLILSISHEKIDGIFKFVNTTDSTDYEISEVVVKTYNI
jgi:alkaline phosphatase D